MKKTLLPMPWHSTKGQTLIQSFLCVYKGQPAADTGGVLRHFFTDLLQKLSDTYFTGTSCKVPLYNTNILICGLMKMIGTVIVYSVVQGGPGFPFFSPAVFSYSWSGSVDAAVQHLNIDDCASPQCKEIVLKVRYALLLSNSKLLQETVRDNSCG